MPLGPRRGLSGFPEGRLCGKTWPSEARKNCPSTYGQVKRNFAQNRVNLFTIALFGTKNPENIRENIYFPFSVDQ